MLYICFELYEGNPFGAYQIINKCNDLLKLKEDSSQPQGQRLFALEVIGKLYLELGRLLGSCFPDTGKDITEFWHSSNQYTRKDNFVKSIDYYIGLIPCQ